MASQRGGVSLRGILKCLDKMAPLRRAESWDNGIYQFFLTFLFCLNFRLAFLQFYVFTFSRF